MKKVFIFIFILTSIALQGNAMRYVDQVCIPTPAAYKIQPLPEFYHSNNMRSFIGMTGHAKGRNLVFEGRVYDNNCIPIPNAIVEIWHKNSEGIYNDDIRHMDLWDKNFTGTGSAQTDNWGRFAFYTIFPGTSDKHEMRHIDLRVRHPDFPILETRMYFEGFYTGRDSLLRGFSDSEKRQLISNREKNIGDALNFSILLVLDGQNRYKIN